ncbi:FAD binding domain-containing protein [Frondihabitans sucicola]|uniref:FAD binding domain-containing protein n=1 Tax=Frondihabitans sucicola TaxID=1268041 RepID=UPI0025735342|nr:FAD binding domain-containing protein [Frondihabitans sucicola]
MARTRDDIVLGEGVRALGGGTWLFSEPQPGVTGLVDLTGLGWPAVVRTDDALVVAATCTIRDLTRVPAEPDWPAHRLFRLCADSLLASFKIWNVATVGGNIATALPAGAMTSLMSALDATAVIWGPEHTERRIPVAEFVRGVRSTDLRAGEILRAIEVPSAALRSRVAFRRIALSNLGRSGSLVIGRAAGDGSFVVTITAATPRPIQLRFTAAPTAGELEHALDGIDPWYDDPHGAPDWREAVTRLFAEEIREELA